MIETENEIQLICDTYFLHMIKNHESPTWLEFTIHEDLLNEFELEFDISYPNSCRISFYDESRYVIRYK